jgi:uncharacterized membrane protein (DUF4010 family)
MGDKWAVRVYFMLTAISVVTFVWVVWVLGHVQPPGLANPLMPFAIALVSQAILMIWCVRDISRRTFPNSATTLNWAAAVLFLGVVGTTAYVLCVKKRQWKPR